ncbi:hypothetical protein EYW49_12930 [Siculibacillus lacustris]|uniref:Band 7 domain-containing protein n=1 Tax=Siculibacillus lacustris TaxID=1549641 RepID=A0A4Q9VPB7_9HYPH|nr:hypothetical protein [Siculibacillus lacustris]TBW37047.1 hypothetical protein EYW49_12930 [Siculibacillus lacustris]
MLALTVFLLAILAAVVVPPRLPQALAGDRRTAAVFAVRFVTLLIAGAAVLSTSVVRIGPSSVGVVQRLYLGGSLSAGHVIATAGETGFQADIIPPGAFHIWPFYNVLNTIHELPVVVVPNGFYGRIVANDGEPLAEGEVMAEEWPEAEFAKFLDAEWFLQHHGKRGLQLSILKPGVYPLNLALFSVRIGYEKNGRDITDSVDDVYSIEGKKRENTPLTTAITRVPAGTVGVVRSTVARRGIDCVTHTASTDVGGLTAEVVPMGCKGIWRTSLPPNDYYLNRDAYDVTLVSTRVTTLEFKGGFVRRFLDLKVDAKGDFQQTERSANFSVPDGAADSAVNTKVEGWEIPQELRAIVQITPENAPIVVAAVGGQDQVDQRIVIPAIRSHVRNVYGSEIAVTEPDGAGGTREIRRPTRVLDTIDHRVELENAILDRARVDGRRAGVDIKEIRLGESAIPPELLLARQREQLAGQLKAAYIQEQTSQEQRQKTEQARATADQQRDLVKAQIAVKTAQLAQDRRQAEGHAERLFLEEQAAGQTAQANVLGKDSVLRLRELELVLTLLRDNPQIVTGLKLPSVWVSGSNGLEGTAAVLGAFLGGAVPEARGLGK